MNKRAEFNTDTNCVDVYVNEYAEKPKISICTPLIEDSLRTSPYANSQLQFLAEDKPMEYAEMVANGTLDDYMELCKAEDKEQSKAIRTRLSKHYKNMSETQIDSLVREFMMYDS